MDILDSNNELLKKPASALGYLQIDSISGKENNTSELIKLTVNASEGYCTLNKFQSRIVFWVALGMCVLGILFAFTVLMYHQNTHSSDIIASMAPGAIMEIIAGLLFLIYNKTIKQANMFYASLQDRLDQLLAIQLIEKVSPERKDEIIMKIISSIGTDRNTVTTQS